MSIYYFLVCDEHKEICPGASNGSHLYNSEQVLPEFITNHSGCTLRIITDGADDDIFNTYRNYSEIKIKSKSFIKRLFKC